jgi:hypothetical protein
MDWALDCIGSNAVPLEHIGEEFRLHPAGHLPARLIALIKYAKSPYRIDAPDSCVEPPA